MATQQYMFKDEEGIGKISYSEKEISERINLSRQSINRCNKSLKEKGYLTLLPTKNPSGNALVNEKVFKLTELGQAVVFTLQKHDERINENEKTIELMVRRIQELENMLELKKEQKEVIL